MAEPLRELADLARLPAVANLPTPAVLVDEAAVEHNIAHTVGLLGDAARWRAHVKTARTGWAIERLAAAGVTRFKASTVAELAALLDHGATDVLLAYPAIGPAREAAADLAERHPSARVAVLVDTPDTVTPPGRLAAFLDVDTGMHRTGIDVADHAAALDVVRAYGDAGWPFAGIHAYDGHLADRPDAERAAAVGTALRQVTALATAVETLGVTVAELTLAGSHTFRETLAAACRQPRVTVGAGTVVYNDTRNLARFAGQPGEPGYRAAAGILTRVVSRGPGRVTVDAGLTAVQVDGGRPHAAVAGHPGVTVGTPSQEHLVLGGDVERFAVGELLVLVPRHVDTALVQFPGLYRVDVSGAVRAEAVVGRYP